MNKQLLVTALAVGALGFSLANRPHEVTAAEAQLSLVVHCAPIWTLSQTPVAPHENSCEALHWWGPKPGATLPNGMAPPHGLTSQTHYGVPGTGPGGWSYDTLSPLGLPPTHFPVPLPPWVYWLPSVL